jgi:cytochrome P450
VLLHDCAALPKSPLEKQVLHTRSATASSPRKARAGAGSDARLRRCSVPPICAGWSGMTAAAQDQLARWRSAPAGTIRAIDRDMTETTFHVVSATMFAGSAGPGGPPPSWRQAVATLATISWDVARPCWACRLVLGAGQAAPAPGGAVACATPSLAYVERRRREGLHGTDLLARSPRPEIRKAVRRCRRSSSIDNLVTFLAAGHETTAKA